ncbi:MAG: hypothetical protein J7L43_00800 [Candidatus Aenigmarchaeota archaeon]|nr:hypothetical protein [Candidatus Aenigmarchaeota archaeon]
MTTKTDLEDLFLRKKPMKLLISLSGDKKKYVSVLAKETDCTYSHVVKLLNIFKKMGIAAFEKEGRVKYVRLTPEGQELVKGFETLLRKFSKFGGQK